MAGIVLADGRVDRVPVAGPDLTPSVLARRTEDLRAARSRRRGVAALVGMAALAAIVVGLVAPTARNDEPTGETAGPSGSNRTAPTSPSGP